ncbi:MAG: dienelactone hydrolase family protein [Polyangiaceae bacterium]|nr:dienelactone hydrolase family protein [Polyangiaceae bacterium]
MRHLPLSTRSATARSLIALSIACLGACSEGTSSSDKNDTGNGGSSAVHESGGTPGSGGVVGTGGTTTASGGTATASGGTATSSGGAATATGGTTTASGGTTAATGGTVGAGGTTTASGGTTTSSGGRTGGRGGRSAGTGGGATGGDSAAGGTSATGGISATGGSGTQAGGSGGTSGGGTSAGGGSVGGAGTGGGSAGDSRSPGCGTTISRPNPRTQQTMDIGGATRYYLLDVPSSADNQTPLMLIFALHGYDMNNVAVLDRYNFNSRSGGKAITVYPYGEGPAPGDVVHWGDQVLKSTWNGNEANYNFIHTLMTDLESRFCIDTSRVFLTGFSMGGFFTNGLACAHSDWFRAFAPVSGGVAGQSCADASVKPAMMIHHGTADPIVEFSSGEATRDYWTKQNGCSQTSKSSFTGCESYDGCAQPVIFCVGNWEHDITGTAAGNIWSFFSGLE